MNDIEIAVFTLVAIIVGGLFRVLKGTLDAKNKGEKFEWGKFLSTSITALVESVGIFYLVNELEVAINGASMMILIIGGFLLGYYGAKPSGKTIKETLAKLLKGGAK